MPAYWRPYANYRRRYQTRRRRRWRFLPWRTRQTFRRKYKTRKHRRRFRKVKRRRFNKKKLKLIVQQFQPKSIRKCKIVGTKCLFQGSTKRCNFNYLQYVYSKVPEKHPGGGGWGLMVFSLDSLYEDWLHLQNIWTNSNAGLPLVRYLGTSFKFYQSEDTDYIVYYDRCWPMVDTPHTHADCSPQSMFLKKRKIPVPSRKTQRNKKPYKKVFIKPPTQMQTKWYFQKDICTTPLLMLAATAVSFTYPFCSPKADSNNISIKCISPFLFQNPNFQSYPTTSGYSPKRGTSDTHSGDFPLYLYATTTEQTSQGIQVDKTNIKTLSLIPLVNTKDYQAGTPMTNTTWENKPKNWGNPFYFHYLDQESYSIYISDMSPYEATLLLQGSSTKQFHLTIPTTPLIYTVRYNPDTDTGDKNIVYLVSNSAGTSWDLPSNKNLIFDGFPLPILCWGWNDWIKKGKFVIDPDENYIQVIQTDKFDVKLPYYIPIDIDYLEGYDPYVEHQHDGKPVLPSTHSLSHWYPKFQFQQQSYEKICMSGQGCPRVTNSTYIQAYCKYKSYFKFGGCPKTLEKVYNPCQQPKWTTPDNIYGRLEIQNPNTPPETEIFKWDWDSDYITEECIERIKLHTTTDPTTVSFTESKSQPRVLKKAQEKDQTCSKEEEKLLQQLLQLQQQRQQLQQLLLNKLTLS
nr:MAG: ORF1 [TTV-like mini virus]